MELRIADEPARRARDRHTHDAWGSPLTVEQYLLREERLRAGRWARSALTTWFLVEDEVILASCEVFGMAARSGPESGLALAIASVYTDPPLRGRGHASTLLRRLEHEVFRRTPGALAAILFSDVGEPIYARLGYAARPALDLVVAPGPGDPAAPIDALLPPSALDEAHARIRPPDDPFLVWPDAAQLDWHLERERAYADLLGRAPLPACGARAGDSTALWMASFRDHSLKLLLVDARRPDELRALLAAASRLAHAAGLRDVRAFRTGLPPGPLPPIPDARLEPRDGAIPMILPLAPAIRPDDWHTIPRAIWV